MDAVDCRVFEDQLDLADAGSLPDDASALLHAHAAVCPSCATLLRLRAHLPGPSLADLEARVPEAWVDGMVPAVQRALEARERQGGEAVGPTGRRRGFALPLLVAAVVALLLSTGLALVALDRSRDRAEVLAAQLLDQERRLAAFEAPSTPGAIPAARLTSRESWLRELESTEVLTVSDLKALLEQLPGDMALMGPRRTRELARSRWVPSPWREAFRALPDDGGATAADLLDTLDRIGLPLDAVVPTRRLLDLLG
jgi:hypothetical protein